MTSANDEVKEVRAQRHDFIKEYYKMAIMDLDRHLKGGWQTIAVLGGGAAILTAGHDGKIGLPIATAIALTSAFWGALTVVDANYWSLRAIGFLANVEAIYFSVDDRKHFHPYVGYHPPFKLLNSLRYMFWLCVLFGAAAFFNLLWEVMKHYPTLDVVWARLTAVGPVRLALWGLPLLTAVWGSFWVLRVWRKRLVDYIAFTRDSPGPGVRLKSDELRHVTLQPVGGGSAPLLEANPQGAMLAGLEASLRRHDALRWPALAFGVVLTLGFAAFVVYQAVAK